MQEIGNLRSICCETCEYMCYTAIFINFDEDVFLFYSNCSTEHCFFKACSVLGYLSSRWGIRWSQWASLSAQRGGTFVWYSQEVAEKGILEYSGCDMILTWSVLFSSKQCLLVYVTYPAHWKKVLNPNGSQISAKKPGVANNHIAGWWFGTWL